MSFDDEDTTEAHERRITRCRTCRARIVFLPTNSGKQMPCDADSVGASDDVYVHGKHESHFGKCTNAALHRRPR